MSFDWVLFDADETLFKFDSYEGLRRMFSSFDVNFTREDFDLYQACNLRLWKLYQSGEIEVEVLKHQRFEAWAKKLEVTTELLNKRFLEHMADVCHLLPGVQALLSDLKRSCKLGIITNGFTDLQQARLERQGLSDTFDLLIISEEVGAAKPSKQIYQHAYEKMGSPDKEKVLMVGDNPIADVGGAKQFGFKTCWYNPHSVQPAQVVDTDIEVNHHDQLSAWIKSRN